MKRPLLPLLLFSALAFNLRAAQIDRVEYFIDADPGHGNGAAITISPAEQLDAAFTIDLSGIEPGFHWLGVRSRDSQGQWSLTFTQPFHVVAPASLKVPDVTALEYYIDDDPGIGQGISVPLTPATTIEETFTADLSGVSNGPHVLYVRVRDSKGAWSLIQSAPFIATLPPVPPHQTRISIERSAGGLTLTYSGVLQSADTVTGPYSDVTGATSPANIAFDDRARFYRLKP